MCGGKTDTAIGILRFRKDRDRCRGNKKGGDNPWDVSPFEHAPIPEGWKNEGISVIINESAPRGINISDESLIARWHANSMSLPNTSIVKNKFVSLIHYTGNLYFDNDPHVKNIKVSSPLQKTTYIRGVELQENKSPKPEGPPYLYIDSKLDTDIEDFTISFFYKHMDENSTEVKDLANIMNYAQGVFAYNYKPTEFVRMFTLKNGQSTTGTNIVRYFGNSVPVDGTSLYVDGGPFKEPQMIVSKINKNDTFYVTIKYKKPTLQTEEEVDISSDSYVVTKSKLDGFALGEKIHDKAKEEFSGKDIKIIYIEDLIENEDIIRTLTPAKLNNVGFLVREPKNLSSIGGSHTEHFYNQSSRLKRPYYLQLNTNGLTHTYKGSHPFKKYNLYIKSQTDQDLI